MVHKLKATSLTNDPIASSLKEKWGRSKMCLITLMDLIALIGPSGTAGFPLNNEVAMMERIDKKLMIGK